jgi:hypothetical protein
MKKTVRYAAVFFLSVGILALLAPGLKVKAQQVGVVPGQYFTYGTSDGSPWVTMYPSYWPPLSQWEKFENLTTWNFTIVKNPQAADYPTQIWFNESVKFSNGTAVQPITSWVDIDTAQGSAVLFFAPAGLRAGEPIYPGSSNFTYTINGTTTNAHWPGRTIAVLNVTSAQLLGNGTNPFAERTVIYWDYSTGVLLSAFEEASEVSTQLGMEIHGYLLYELIANNALIPMYYPGPLNMTPIYIMVALGSVSVVAFAVIRLTSKPTKKYKPLKGR